MLNVIIPEPIPSLNKGELAILEGLREALNIYGEYNLTVYSLPQWYKDAVRNSKGEYNIVGGVDLFDFGNAFLDIPEPRTRFYFFKTWGKLLFFSLIYRMSKKLALVFFNDPFLKAIAQSDLILAAHDGVLSSLHFYFVLAGKIMGKSVALFGGGNDLKGRSSFKIRKFFQYAINNSILCTVRDPGTRNYLINNDVSPEKVHLFPDPAVLLKPCSEERTYEILKKEGIPHPSEKPLYGLIPVRGGIVFAKSFTAEHDLQKKHEMRVRLWVDILNYLLETTDAHFVFLPHCIGPVSNNDDRRMSRDIYDAIQQKNRFTYVDSEYSAGELKGIMQKSEFVLGERTHGLIGAVTVATPCLALTAEEDLRMHYIMEGMFNRKTYNLNNPDVEALKKILSDEWSNRTIIAAEMREKAKEILAEAHRAASLLKEAINNNIKVVG